jgi:hypothetical protein
MEFGCHNGLKRNALKNSVLIQNADCKVKKQILSMIAALNIANSLW